MHPFTSKTRHPLVLSLLALLVAAACGRAAAPTLSSTSPADQAIDVPVNVKLSASFDVPMSPLTTTTFTLAQGTTPVAGSVANAVDARSATFSPSTALAAGTVFTATVTTGAKSAGGESLAMNRSWTFTTGMASDLTPPTVTAISPAAGSVGAALNTRVTARFSKAMDPLTLNGTSFTVKQGGVDVPGTISYGPGAIATFKSAGALTASTLVSVNLATTIKDLQGNALAEARSWSFTTGTTASLGPAPVELGAAGDFALLAKAAISTVPASSVVGDIGLGPAAATYMTGFSLVADATNVFAVSTQVTGKLFAASYAVPTPANLTLAVSNMESAYTDAETRPTPDHLELSTGNLGGLTLAPGLYKWTSSITVPTDVTFNGGANDTWILQTTGDVTTAAMTQIVLAGGARAKNIVWQVAGNVTLGATSHFEGVVLCKTEITAQTGATINGRLLAQTQIALQQSAVTQPAQ